MAAGNKRTRPKCTGITMDNRGNLLVLREDGLILERNPSKKWFTSDMVPDAEVEK